VTANPPLSGAGAGSGPGSRADERHVRRMGSDESAVGRNEAVAAPGRGGPRSAVPRRRLALVCLALLGAALALWASSRLTWFTAGIDAVGRGTVPVRATGADLAPALVGIALLVAAAVPAAVALAGALRRALGVLVAAGGVVAGATVATRVWTPPTAVDLAALPGAPAGGTAADGPVAAAAGPLPAVLATLLLLTAGAVLVVRERGLPRFGARYAARPADPTVEPVTVDPDRATWDALDAGRDPTADPPVDPTAAVPPATDRDRPGRTDGDGPGGPV
jgi:uncharacterized membrane protein (TIGR02234 family)